jgi:hypothetical protein
MKHKVRYYLVGDHNDSLVFEHEIEKGHLPVPRKGEPVTLPYRLGPGKLKAIVHDVAWKITRDGVTRTTTKVYLKEI